MKAILTFLALLALAFFAVDLAPAALAADGSDAAAVVTAAGDTTVPWLDSIVTQYPWLSTVLIVIGAFRLVAKPLMSLAHSVAAYTTTTKDDVIVEKVEASWAWRAFCWLLDWTASVKIGTQRPTPTPTVTGTASATLGGGTAREA